MNYNKKKKLNHRLLNLMTFLVVVFNLFPIIWMVYTSFMDNNDVMLGKIKMDTRDNDGVFITTTKDEIILGTTDGSLSSFSKKDALKNDKHLNTNSFVPSFSENGNDIWMFSADKGLMKINKISFHKEDILGFEDFVKAYENQKNVKLPKMYVTDMIRTNVLALDKEVFVGFWEDNSFGLAIYDKNSKKLSFVDGSDGLKSSSIKQFIDIKDGKLSILTKVGIEVLDLATKKIVEVLKPIDREEFNLVAKIDDDDIVALNRTGRSLLIYKKQGSYLKRVDEISSKDSIPFTKATSLTVDKKTKEIIFGTATTGEVFKIKYSKQVVVDSIEPALEAPVEDAKNAETVLVFDFKNYKEFKTKVKGSNDVLVFKEDKDKTLIIGGDQGYLSIINKEVSASTVAPAGSLYIHWRNYIDVFKNIDFGLYLKNSLIICTSVMIIAMLLASLAGYSLARYRFPGKDVFGYAILATQMVPGIMFLIPIYLMFVKFNELTGIPVKGTYWSIIFTYSAFFVPFSIWILRGFFASIPKALEEAALIDGCNPLQAFYKIIIPTAMPGIVATGIYVFLLAWDELMFAWILTNEHTYTIPVGIRNFAGNYQNRYDLMMAAATIATIPVMFLFFIMQKQIVSGLTSGAVKE